MKYSHLIVLTLGLIPPRASAQEHLIPATDTFADPDTYKLKLRHIFAQAFDESVLVRVLVTAPIMKEHSEYVAGVQATVGGFVAFVLEPSSRVWDTELIEGYESGEYKTRGLDGKVIPLGKNETYQELKRTTPKDYRSIKAVRRSRPVPRDLAERIRAVWEIMLLDVRHPPTPQGGSDGTEYDFSGWFRGRGELSGHVWSPSERSKTRQLTRLAHALAEYANGKNDLARLREQVDSTERAVRP